MHHEEQNRGPAIGHAFMRSCTKKGQEGSEAMKLSLVHALQPGSMYTTVLIVPCKHNYPNLSCNSNNYGNNTITYMNLCSVGKCPNCFCTRNA